MIFFNISLLMLKLIKFRRLPLKTYNLKKKMNQITKIMALIGQKSSRKHTMRALIASKLLNIKTAIVDARDIIIKHWNIVLFIKVRTPPPPVTVFFLE